MQSFLITAAIAAAISVTSPQTVEFPIDMESADCPMGGGVTAIGNSDVKTTALAFGQRELGGWFERGTDDDLLLVLGADKKALWVIEAYVPDTACDDCERVILREIRFDGRRFEHDLSERRDEHELQMPTFDLVSKRLSAWYIITGKAASPVAYQLNQDQQPSHRGVSSWVLRVRDSLHRKSYVWRRHVEANMCWCFSHYAVSTYPWSQET